MIFPVTSYNKNGGIMWPIASLLQCLCEIEGSRSPACSVRNSEVSWDEASRSVMSLPCPWPGVRASCTEAKGLRTLVDPDEGCNWDLEGPEAPVKDEIELNNKGMTTIPRLSQVIRQMRDVGSETRENKGETPAGLGLRPPLSCYYRVIEAHLPINADAGLIIKLT